MRLTLAVGSLLVVPALLLTDAGAAAAPAEDPLAQQREEARSLATEALARIDRGELAEGLALLEQAEAKFHAPTHLLYLAQTRAALGQLVAAAETYERLANETLPNYAPDAFREAQRLGGEELSRLTKRLARARIAFAGPSPASFSVRVDGEARLVFGGVVYVEPGRRSILVESGGRSQQRAVDVSPGSEATATFTWSQGGTAPADRAPPLRTPGIVLLALGGAGAIAGATCGGLSLAKVAELEERCPNKVGCSASDEPLADEARALGNASTALVAVGGAALVTGLVLVLWPAPAPDASATSSLARRVRPWIGPGLLGAEGVW